MKFKTLFYLPILLSGLTACCSDADVKEAKEKLYNSLAKDKNDAAQMLARCPSDGADAVPRLIELMYDDNIGVQSSAAYALRKIDTPRARQALDEATKARRK